ncbi:MAG: GntR family transcriptional regulator [Halieaceae bacterium]
MTKEWNESQPIYLQLREQVVGCLMDGTFSEGEAVPSVRQVSSEYQINHLTVAKAYQELVDDGLLEKRRGLGMFVVEGARQTLLQNEQKKFIDKELPDFATRVKQLGLDIDVVANQLAHMGERV